MKTDNINMHDHFEYDLVLDRLSTGGVNYRYNDLTDQQIFAIEHAVNTHDKRVADFNRINQRVKELGPVRDQLEKIKDDIEFLNMTIEHFRTVNTQLKEEQMKIIAALGPYHCEGDDLAKEVLHLKEMIEGRY
jgi:archaellum component FlaC